MWLEEWLKENEVRELNDCKAWKESMPVLYSPIIGIETVPGSGCTECNFAQQRKCEVTAHMRRVHNLTSMPSWNPRGFRLGIQVRRFLSGIRAGLLNDLAERTAKAARDSNYNQAPWSTFEMDAYMLWTQDGYREQDFYKWTKTRQIQHRATIVTECPHLNTILFEKG